MVPNDFKYSKVFLKERREFIRRKTNIAPINNYGLFRSKISCEKQLWTTVDNFVNN